jgi:hypothetical protein
MNTLTTRFVVRRLGLALSASALAVFSPGMPAQVSAPQQAPAPQQELAPLQDPLTQEPAQKQDLAARTTATGSHIARVRKDSSLPVLVLDRPYIDQSGTNTPTGLLETVPQIQTFRGPALPPGAR